MTTASIHSRVLMWTLGALAVGACLLVGGSWWLIAHEMEEVFEDNLKQVALAVASHDNTNGSSRQPRLAQQLPKVFEEYGKFEFVTQVWTRDGKRVYSSDATVNLPYLSQSGLRQVKAGTGRWHVYTIVLEDSIVQAAQLASERESLARETVSALIVPAVLMLVLIAGLLALALRRGLAPLSLAASEVTARNVEALDAIPLADHPPELHMLVGAINDLMVRLGNAIAVQRDFVADAAHELRTPIAALRLQLQLLERASDAAHRKSAMTELAAGVARSQHLVEQLLQLSRLGPDTPALQRQPVALAALVKSVVADFSTRAEQAGLDLGAVVTASPTVAGDPQQLAILLNNLVTNALRHTPAGGKVDVITGVEQGRSYLAVADTGCGIAPGERERVFDRFYRIAGSRAQDGSGLGLSIVKAVAEQHGATIELSDTPGGGLKVTVSFPA